MSDLHSELRALVDQWRRLSRQFPMEDLDPRRPHVTGRLTEAYTACADQIDALLARYTDYVMVPYEPSEEQRLEGINVALDYTARTDITAPIYRAMIAAASVQENDDESIFDY